MVARQNLFLLDLNLMSSPEGVQYVAGWGWDGEGPQPGNKNFSIASSPLNHPDLYSSNNNLMMWGVACS